MLSPILLSAYDRDMALRARDVNALLNVPVASPTRHKAVSASGRRRQVRESPQRLTKSKVTAVQSRVYVDNSRPTEASQQPRSTAPRTPQAQGGEVFFTPAYAERSEGDGSQGHCQFLKQAEAAIEAAANAARSPAFKVPQAAASVLSQHLAKVKAGPVAAARAIYSGQVRGHQIPRTPTVAAAAPERASGGAAAKPPPSVAKPPPSVATGERLVPPQQPPQRSTSLESHLHVGSLIPRTPAPGTCT